LAGVVGPCKHHLGGTECALGMMCITHGMRCLITWG
jgi:hypothetical protein